MSEEKEKPAKTLISAKNIGILSTVLTALSGASYQIYDWAYESGYSAGKLEVIEEGSDEADELEREIQRLKRKLRKCQKKHGSDDVSETEGSN